MTSASVNHEARLPKLMLWISLEGWDGEAGGRGIRDERTCVYLWLVHVNVWQKNIKIL